MIIIAGLSTVLRPSMESDITLFRSLLPLLFVWLFVWRTENALKLSFLIISFLLYSLFVSFISRFEKFNIPYNLYYITLFFFYYYYVEIFKISSTDNIYRFLKWLYKALLVLGFIQLLFGGVYINTQDRLPAVNIFFWNENEFSSVLAILTPLFFLVQKNVSKYFWILFAVYLMAHNDAKLAILSLIVFFGGYVAIMLKIFKIKYIGLFLIAFLGITMLILLKDFHIQGEVTIKSFIGNLAQHLMEQEPLVHIGTFNARSNAVILGIKEFVNSYFIGIGPGNSRLMMQEIVVPGTEKWTALSMHNFTLQLVTEMGVFGLLILGFFFQRIYYAALHSFYPTNLVYVFYVSCLISITLLSGAWSNYFYLFILFYSLDFFKYHAKTKA